MPQSVIEPFVATASKAETENELDHLAISEEEFDRQLDTAIESSKQTKRLPTLRDFYRDLQDIRRGTTATVDPETVTR